MQKNMIDFTTESLIDFAIENPRLLRIKPSIRYPHLSVAKYTKTAFFGSVWNQFLEESRGLVLNERGEIAVLPFRKIYNYGIDKESPKLPLDTMVTAYRKINGFMLGVTRVAGIDELVFSTTGSLDSEFVGLAKSVYDWCAKPEKFEAMIEPGYTYLFECVHPADPHIIVEDTGLYYLGRRKHSFSAPVENDMKTRFGFINAGAIAPGEYRMTLGELIKKVKTVDHEGFVFYADTGETAKLKSPFYLAAKMFGRENLDVLLEGRARNRLDEELWPLVDYVESIRERFETLTEQEKIGECRDFQIGRAHV